MPHGAFTSSLDVAQVVLYAFWLFFAGLIFYLRREDKREGYPLDSDRTDGRVVVQGFPAVPKPKVFLLAHGGTQTAPRVDPPQRPLQGVAVGGWPGAPIEPQGNPMLSGLGPASFVDREDVPDASFDDGLPKIVPLRVAPAFFIEPRDPDPRGFAVIAADGRHAGTIADAWVDRSEFLIRYLEVELAPGIGSGRVLVPMTLARVRPSRGHIVGDVKVNSVTAAQFADAPVLQHPEQVTLREEDRICAYFASGHLYADPSRLGPLL